MTETISPRQALARKARAAAEAGDWPAARAAWTAALQGAQSPPPLPLSLGLLRALAGLGEVADARAQTAIILAQHPENEAARDVLLRLLITRHDRVALAEEAAAGSLAHHGGPQGQMQHFRALTVLGDLPASRAAFDRMLPSETLPSRLNVLFERAPGCFGPARLAARWDAIASRLAAADAAGHTGREAVFARTLALRLDVARGHHAAFLASWARGGEVLPGWQLRFASLARRLNAPGFPDRTQRRVFGIGLSKTGTTSLAEALTTLGYDTAQFRNPYTNTILDERDADLFDAMNDGPVAARYDMLFDRYPNAVFILTERSAADWQDSVLRHRQRARGTTAPRDMAALAAADGPDSPLQQQVFSTSIWRGENLVQTYETFVQQVHAFFAARAPARLLVLNIFEGQGWPELCTFLGHDAPAMPFPHANRVAPAAG
jgi:hypothetical protein